MLNNLLLTEKYRPQILNNFVGNEDLKRFLNEKFLSKEIPNLLFYGSPGTGKTSLAKLVVKNLDADYLYINASDERGIDTIREKIIPFASSMGFKTIKIVILDEADYLTPQAQATLRNTIETFSANCRFIFTCNYLDRIILPLQSRCVSFNILPADKKAVGKHIMEICDKENISYTKDELANIILTYYPDIRKILNTIQGSISNNKLTLDTKSLINTDFENKIIETLKTKPNITTLRQIIADSGATQFESLFRCLYDNVEQYTTKTGDAIVVIAQYQYEYTFVIDKEICIAAMLNKLIKL